MLITSRCPVCGLYKQACAGHSAKVTPVDLPTSTRTENTMVNEEPELAIYEYEVYGNTVTGQLTKAHAERIGARPVGQEAAGDAPASKARKSVQNK